jgi:NAD(P)-dependent dehydrogenase (short-subunit alcohol dehydrogenase family)
LYDVRYHRAESANELEASMTQSPPVALVTGGARGIGAGVTARLAKDGWRVIVADREPSGAAPVGGRYALCDVGDEPSVSALLHSIGATEQRLDALVCNAGFMIRKPIGELSLAEWSSVLTTNLTSTFLLVRAAEKLLRAAKGAVVTIASTRARMSEPNTESYSASKGGLVALTHALAISLGPDIRVNCISPGWILTKGPDPNPQEHAFHPAGRVGRSEDIAGLAAFLLGPQSGFITGAEFVVDGGVTRKMIYPE